MSGRKEIMVAGYPLDDEDLQRAYDAAASADEIIDEVLFTPQYSGSGSPAYVKSVTPLGYEHGSTDPRLIVHPGGFGGCVIRPFRVVVGLQANGNLGASTLPVINPASTGPSQVASTGISATNAVQSNSVTHTNGDSTHPRYDVVYCLVQRATSVQASREFKDPTSGDVTTQSLALASDATMTFGIVAGTPAASPSVPSLPADSSTAWYVPLADVYIPTGFNAAATFIGSAGSSISQAWSAGGIPPERVREYRKTVGFNGNSSGIQSQQSLAPRDGGVALDRMMKTPKVITSVLVSIPGSGNTATIDTNYDWRFRLIKATILRPPSQGSGVLYPQPDLVTVGGAPSNVASIDWFFSGNGSVTMSAGTPAVVLGVSSLGALTFKSANASTDGANGDSYVIMVEMTPQFVGASV